MNLRPPLLGACALSAVWLAGCMVGPNYHRTDTPVAATWKTEGPWRQGEPSDQLGKGDWWTIFGDSELNSLEVQAAAANQDIQVAITRLEQARAQARIAVAGLYPQANTGPTIGRGSEPGNRPFNPPSSPATTLTSSTFEIPFTVNWEPDFFGRIRRNIESLQASYQASGADLANVRLTIAAEVGADYFTLRQLDTQIAVLDRSVASFEKGLQLVENRQQGGVASGLDVAQEQTLLDGTRTQAILLRQQRAQSEDAIAVLIGQPAPTFRLPFSEISARLPAVPSGVPSDLLERRPDIAEAERQMAAANAQIGVAMAAYYPSFPISLGGGLESFSLTSLANSNSAFWAVGVSAFETIFTGGARRAQVQYQQAGYQGTIATYRGTVLNAFREVEDSLAGLAVLDQAEKTQAAAVADARKALDIATNRYTGGLVNYLDVITAQQTLLSNESLAAQLDGERLVTSVQFVKALGGGWDASSIAALKVKPSIKQAVEP
jgi:multidrug efflux system outer membrane protein